MRTYDEYKQILALWEQGINKKAIARQTGIPRGTVMDCIKRFGTIDGLEKGTAEIQEILLITNLKNVNEFTPLHKSYAYLLGLYLGDGHLVKMRRVYRLRVFLDAKYPGIIQECVKAIEALLPNNRVGIVENYYQGHLSHLDVSSYYKYWADVFPQHGDGMKHTRTIQLDDWQQSIVNAFPLDFFRGLYHSDGCRSQNIVNGKDYPRYSFTNVSTDITTLFTKTCDQLGVHWTVKVRRSNPREQATDIFIAKRKDVEYLDSLVGPKR
jgi:hypothetical protein